MNDYRSRFVADFSSAGRPPLKGLAVFMALGLCAVVTVCTGIFRVRPPLFYHWARFHWVPNTPLADTCGEQVYFDISRNIVAVVCKANSQANFTSDGSKTASVTFFEDELPTIEETQDTLFVIRGNRQWKFSIERGNAKEWEKTLIPVYCWDPGPSPQILAEILRLYTGPDKEKLRELAIECVIQQKNGKN